MLKDQNYYSHNAKAYMKQVCIVHGKHNFFLRVLYLQCSCNLLIYLPGCLSQETVK